MLYELTGTDRREPPLTAIARHGLPLALDDRAAYSLGEVAVMLGKSPRTLKRLHDAGKMPARRLGRSLMIPTSWVRQYAEAPS